MADWFRTEVKPQFPKAHISCTYRNQAEQELAFTDGKSKLHYPKSAHNEIPSRAIDLFQLEDDGKATWPPVLFTSINDINEKTGLSLLWGGKFRSLGDADHFQMK